MQITFVKKILADGSPCKKCGDVIERLELDGLFHAINKVSIADERDHDSEGMRLARQYNVQRAPFFLIQDESGQVEVFDIYFKFKKALADLNTA